LAIADGFRLLGEPLPWLPVSLTPYAALGSLLCLIPPLAIFSAMTRLKAYHPSWIAVALLAGAMAGIVLGAAQVASANPRSPWYLYPEVNFGSAVGFFANSNHMADLLVICLPFVAAIAVAGKRRNIQGYSALLAILTGVAVVVVVGITLNRSLAGYLLSMPVLAGSAMILLPPSNKWRTAVTGLAALGLIASVAALSTTSIGGTKVGSDATVSVQSRQQILATTGEAITDNMPWGSGLGSFLHVYRLYERPESVTTEYVIHAHNDYAEIALELGLPGIILALLFLTWWAPATVSVWRMAEAGPFSRAASIASAAILAHSLVDFPLRTAAISGSFAAFCALLVDRRSPMTKDQNDLRPTRHLVIG
jgi:O-antigen ligase